ncbi:MAG: methyltransferase domain-containing protein, partial [Fuerstiella sp.]
MLALRFFSAAVFLVAIVVSSSNVQADSEADAKKILSESGVSAGFVVHLGAGDGSLTAALRQNDLIQVHGLESDPTNVQVARKRIRDAGDYGEVSVVKFNGKLLPYVDNLVNLFVTEDVGEVPLTEIVRVLVPNGVAMVKGADGKWTKTVKPRPDDIDEWSHYLHDASGNSV